MRDKSKGPRIPKRLGELLKKARARGMGTERLKKLAKSLRGRLPQRLKDADLDLRKVDLSNIAQYSPWIRWGLTVLAIFLLAEVVARAIGLYIKPGYLPVAQRGSAAKKRVVPQEDFEAILRRNMFNVEGFIPDPFDQGQVDCFTQARQSSQRIELLGTIVMSNEKFSVALLQREGSADKIGVKEDEVFFDGKFQAMKIDRKRLCFQILATQEFEYVEIPDEFRESGPSGPALTTSGAATGIKAVSDGKFEVQQSFLEKNLLNLNEILQTARAVPYTEPGTGKFKGFLIQSIDNSSPFAQLGIRQGDILTAVNDIVLDNAGKGLEAFQRLRNSPKVSLEVLRGGSKTTLSYDVK